MLPLKEINFMFLFPIFIHFLFVLFPNIFIFLINCFDFGTEFIQSLFFALFPIFVLLILFWFCFSFLLSFRSNLSFQLGNSFVFRIEFFSQLIKLFIQRSSLLFCLVDLSTQFLFSLLCLLNSDFNVSSGLGFQCFSLQNCYLWLQLSFTFFWNVGSNELVLQSFQLLLQSFFRVSF